MNLSSYLQMPPAPNASKSPATSPVSGSGAGARVDAGNGLGLDFAQIMSRQLERLPQLQRQEMAAPAPLAHAAQEASRSTPKRSDASDDRRSDDRREARDARDESSNRTQESKARTQDKPERDNRDSASATDHTERNAREHNARTTRKTPAAQEQADAALLQAFGSLPMAPSLVTPALEPSQATLRTSSGLQTIALSSHIQIITDPQQAPSPESLAAFAKSMGLDETAIQALLAQGGQPTAASNTVVTHGLNALVSQSPTHPVLPASVALPTSAHSASQALMTTLDTQSGASTTDNTTLVAGPTLTPSATQATATTTLPGSASLLGPQVPAFPGSLLPPMSAADLASIEQIQITVVPAMSNNGASANSPALPSTHDVLSLLTGDLKDQDIVRLSAQFTDGGGHEQPTEHQQGQTPSHSGGFAQVLSGSHQANATQAAQNTNAPTNVPMSQVYEQLSDQLASEMATRMHKQLSEGQWKMTFGLRPAHLGGVEIQLEMKDGKLDALFRADNPLTRDLLQNSSQRLREALENFGIHAGLVHVGQQGGQGQQNASRNSANQPQLGDNSTLQVKGDDSVNATTVASNKANASLLDLYA